MARHPAVDFRTIFGEYDEIEASLPHHFRAVLGKVLLRSGVKSAVSGYRPAHFELRRVSRNNGIRWNTSWIDVSSTLPKECVGLEEIEDGVWSVWFGPVLLGRFHERKLRISGVRNLQ